MSDFGNMVEGQVYESHLTSYAQGTSGNWFFESVLVVAGQICSVPMAAIVRGDANSLEFCASIGLGVGQRDSVVARCRETIQLHDVHIVGEDGKKNGGLDLSRIKLFAGFPLRVYGQPVGVLCVMDIIRHNLTESQVGALNLLAEVVSMNLQQEAHIQELRAQLEEVSSSRVA